MLYFRCTLDRTDNQKEAGRFIVWGDIAKLQKQLRKLQRFNAVVLVIVKGFWQRDNVISTATQQAWFAAYSNETEFLAKATQEAEMTFNYESSRVFISVAYEGTDIYGTWSAPLDIALL